MLTRRLIYLFRVTFVLALVVISYLVTTPMQYQLVRNTNDKLAHLAAFYALALLADLSFPYCRYSLYKALPLLGYGVLIEIVQLRLSYRSFSLLDMVADAVGLLMYGLSIPLWTRYLFPSWRTKTKTW